MNTTDKKAWLSKNTGMALALSLFLVLTHWGFWDIGVYAMGWNTSLFWIVLLAFLYRESSSKKLKKNYLIWTPLILMALSFGIYENPWLKFITMGVLPLATGVFYLYGQMENATNRWWGLHFLEQLAHFFIQPVIKVEKSVVQLFNEIFRAKSNKRAKSIGLGLAILFVLLIVVVIPLLSSADAVFADMMSDVSKYIDEFFSSGFIGRVIFFILSSIAILALFMGWVGKTQLKEEKALKEQDSWISGIVLGGLLGTYLLFLYVQISYLFVGELPLDLESTVQFVKSGFWQLFFLSILNGLLFFNFYKRTSKIPQVILKVFIMASGLLMISAAWRMVLYVTIHGFSYEKFLASYTTVFGLMVFVMLVGSSFFKKKHNLLKAFSFLALWAFAIATIMPIEQMIMRANMGLSEREDSKIEMHELTMLSADVYALTAKNHEEWDSETVENWELWMNAKQEDYSERAWYEMNLSLLINAPQSTEIEGENHYIIDEENTLIEVEEEIFAYQGQYSLYLNNKDTEALLTFTGIGDWDQENMIYTTFTKYAGYSPCGLEESYKWEDGFLDKISSLENQNCDDPSEV